jgi:hypothetical protein
MTKARELADVIGTQSTTENVLQGRRNLIINGAMQVAQRGTSFSTSTSQYTLDRMRRAESSLGTAVITVEQSTDAPEGFSYSFKATTSTVEGAVNADDAYYPLVYRIEAQDCQHLAYSTNAAKTLTASFWVKSSVTGTYVLSLYNYDSNRVIAKTYSISTADTWEYKTLTFSGDTTGGFNNDNGIGLELDFAAGAGSDFTSGTLPSSWEGYSAANFLVGQSVNLQNIANATWQITGVQLEVGSVATPFEHRSYGEELALCQRYFERVGGDANYAQIGMGSTRTTSQTYFNVSFKHRKRAAPSVSFASGIIVSDRYSYDQTVSGLEDVNASKDGLHARFTHSAVGTERRPHHVTSNDSGDGYMDFDSEL